MGKNSVKNRQKKMAKRKAKSKLKQKNARVQGADSGKRMGEVEGAWLEDPGLGLGTFVLQRKAGDGNFWVGAFMVDFQCLGVKNCFLRKVTLMEFRSFMEARSFVPYSPEAMKTAVLTGVEYAKSIGFEPHKDYKKTFKIFDRIDVSSEPCELELGKDGQPFFFPGPFDSPEKCKRIINVLERTCGTGNYHANLVMSEFDEKAGRYVGSEEFR